ncbi:MAG: hypothetical protein CVU50_02070 [Candidatus Cloacimonetes bacterium HGW-Cloacimonetes-3]|jgi:DUF4097 and DUF4098 domain-containing protein YvlB|nr:MAG: hypothetical protein CVU50_02070 [Candidatus Cloacimonetes bacterium HGW-Cloacimonetes-3]
MKVVLLSCCLISIILITGCEEFKKETRDIVNFFSKTSKSTTVNGTVLKYSATDTLKVSFSMGEFSLNEPNADIILSGGDTNEAYLVVFYSEYKPGDATVQISSSSLTIQTKSGKPALITKIEGTLPKGINLDLLSTSGDIRISNFSPPAKIIIESTSGDIAITNCNTGNTNATTVSGDIQSTGLKVTDAITFNTTSGNVKLHGCEAQQLSADTVSGDIVVKESAINDMQGSSVSGDINMISSKVQKRKFSTTSGEVLER